MFYEEKLIDGIMHYRTDPDGEWIPYTLTELSRRYDDKNKILRGIAKLLGYVS